MGEASETFTVDRLQCIMTCLKRGEETKMAAYHETEQLCCCVDRDVEPVEEDLGTREVYLVDFHRGKVLLCKIIIVNVSLEFVLLIINML